jgi:arsenite methyltransferase
MTARAIPRFAYPAWFWPLVGSAAVGEGARFEASCVSLVMADGLLRDEVCHDARQTQTRETFSYKWQREDSYGSPLMVEFSRKWLEGRYAALWAHPAADLSGAHRPLMLDAGCGSAYSAGILLERRFPKLRYVGVDISRAVDVAARSFAERGVDVAVLQADLMHLPFADGSFDIVFSEGVLHHTPSTRPALAAVVRKARKGGAVAFYVYRRKSPVREFTDDYIRDLVKNLPPEKAWTLIEPLTKLGNALGELNAEIDVPEEISLLGIPAGRINVQRLFYWHVCKLFYRPDMTLDEMNHINFDWFTPSYAHRQSVEEVTQWSRDIGLDIVEMNTEEAGITVVATKL